MPCKVTITNYLNDLANSTASQLNKEIGYPILKFVAVGDFIERRINIPQSLIDEYYASELKIEEREARQIQQEDAKRAGVEYTDEYLFQEKETPVEKVNVITLKDGKTYTYDQINSQKLIAMRYTPEQIGKILKDIC